MSEKRLPVLKNLEEVLACVQEAAFMRDHYFRLTVQGDPKKVRELFDFLEHVIHQHTALGIAFQIDTHHSQPWHGAMPALAPMRPIDPALKASS